MIQRSGSHRPALITLLSAGLALAVSMAAGATEVYTWTDEDGVRTFSDAPPPSGESQRIDVADAYSPGTTGAYPSPNDSAGDAEGETEELHSIAEQKREEMRERRDERQQAQAEIERLCNRHRDRVTRMEPARRVFYTNEQGESVRMDDDRRVGMIEESKAYLQENCS